MKSTPTGARPVRHKIVLALLSIVAAAASALVPHVLATAAPPAPAGLWSDSVVPTRPFAADSKVTLGLEFSSNTAGTIIGVQYYASGANRAATTGHVWNSRGTRVASVGFPQTSTDGWKTATLSTPVNVREGEKFTVSYRAASGYAIEENLFSDGRTRTIGALTAYKGTYGYGSGRPTSTWRGSHYFVDVAFVAGTSTSTAAPAPAPAPTMTPAPTVTPAPTPTPTPTPAPTPTTGFPDASNTGVPAGVTLTSYTGPMTITTPGTVIDAKRITGTLTVRATGVQVTRSSVTGSVVVDPAGSLSISDTMIAVGDRPGTGLESYNYTATRVHITGGNRSAYCASDCTIRDSYVHGQFTDETGVAHESGIRMEKNTTLIHNTIACDAPDVPPDAGCSAGLTGYGDFAPVVNNLIQGNLFKATTGGTCAYGGSSGGKPYSNASRDIRFIDNVFERRADSERGTTCGYWFTIADFDSSAPGNVLSGNTYVGGGSVTP